MAEASVAAQRSSHTCRLGGDGLSQQHRGRDKSAGRYLLKACCPSQIMVTSTTLCLAAARFGLAPSAKKIASAGLKLSDRNVDLLTNDPAGVGLGEDLERGGDSRGACGEGTACMLEVHSEGAHAILTDALSPCTLSPPSPCSSPPPTPSPCECLGCSQRKDTREPECERVCLCPAVSLTHPLTCLHVQGCRWPRHWCGHCPGPEGHWSPLSSCSAPSNNLAIVPRYGARRDGDDRIGGGLRFDAAKHSSASRELPGSGQPEHTAVVGPTT